MATENTRLETYLRDLQARACQAEKERGDAHQGMENSKDLNGAKMNVMAYRALRAEEFRQLQELADKLRLRFRSRDQPILFDFCAFCLIFQTAFIIFVVELDNISQNVMYLKKLKFIFERGVPLK